jgi:hypothetical protein
MHASHADGTIIMKLPTLCFNQPTNQPHTPHCMLGAVYCVHTPHWESHSQRQPTLNLDILDYLAAYPEP